MDAEHILLLDGPTGTELERRGVDTSRRLWSARAIDERPEVLEVIHLDYIAAGADIVTVNTFRTNRRAVVGSGLDAADAHRLTVRATEIARRARDRSGRSDLLLAGSDAPVEDCYTPGIVPSDDELLEEHCEHIAALVDAGCDLVLIETMNTLREAVIAARAAAEVGARFIVSVVTATDGEQLLSGERLDAAVEALEPLEPLAILTNCSSPAASVAATEVLARAAGAGEAAWKFGGYANGGEPDPIVGYRSVRAVPVDEFVACSRRMLDAGARIIGSCCGTTPDYTRELSRIVERRRRQESSVNERRRGGEERC